MIMNMHTYTLPKRIIAMILTLVMVLSVMPVLSFGAKAAELISSSTVADANTMNEWKNAFLPNGIPSTDYAGAIWTDKSVLTATDTLPGGVTIGENNFLVALSAMATNSVVTGQGSVPTDTVFVLDISNSMNSTALSGMVAATNNAIRMLMSENPENRVGVVLYSDDITTLLPLDHYTGATSSTITTETFLTYLSNQDVITTGIGTYSWSYRPGQSNYTVTGPTNSAGTEVEARASCTGGTYIQGGLWEAYESHFGKVTDASNRVPAIILMSDGAPTYVSSNFANVGSSTHGAGSASYNGDGFVTQLTAAYIKAKLTEKYGKALIYTVGFGLSTTSTDAETLIATKVLNPSVAHTGIDDLWKTYNALTGTNLSMNVQLGRSNGTTTVSITKSSTALNAKYVDLYLAADNAADLNTAFQNIVNDIALQAGYYPTRTDDNGVNYSGYITFSDTIGAGMAVQSMKGILLDGVLYDGHRLAELIYHTDVNTQYLAAGGDPNTLPHAAWLGTQENPTELGDEFVRAVKQRMGITGATLEEANQKAWALIGSAWQNGHLRYDPDTGEYSNFIVWYGDADGNYVGPYGDGTTIPAGAVYLNYCYGMLGASSAFGLESDMMYITVQVSRNLQTGQRHVTFRIPAAMLPTQTYQVNVQMENGEIVPDSATISVNDAGPIVLLYEVGMDQTLVNPLTIQDYGTPTGDGRYYLYASEWEATTDKNTLRDTESNSMTYAHFEPGPENEHYYFSNDTLLYNADGTVYTGSKPTNNVYFLDTIYTATGTADANGVYKANAHTELVRVASADLINAVQNTDGSWYMPEGTMYANTYDYDLSKTQSSTNATGTHGYVHYHVVDEVDSGSYHHELMYQGNNGRLIIEPAQGITLTKELAAGATALEGQTFAFNIAISGDSDGKVTLTQNGTDTEVTLTGGALTVNLAANETATIWGIDTGATYTITENISEDNSYIYHVSNIKVNGVNAAAASGSVAEYTLTPVVFTNDTVDYGSFTVFKTVTYNNGAAPAVGQTLPDFQAEITLTGYADKKILVDGVETTTDANGKFTVTIRDGQTITISNVPLGTAYAVAETGTLPAGYSIVTGQGNGTVAETVTGVTLENAYTPAQVTPDPEFSITGTKTVVDADGNTTDWHGYTFTIRLQKWNAALNDGQGGWENVPGAEKTVDQANHNFSLPLTEQYTQVGSFMYRIIEDETPLAGVTYDTTRNLFRVIISDTDLDGKLEMSVENVQNTVVAGMGNNSWSVATSFQNIYTLDAATWTPSAVKVLNGRELLAGEFSFRLEAMTTGAPMPSTAPVYDMLSGKGGNILFPAILYHQSDVGKTYEYKLTELSGNLGGVTYDDTVYYISVAVTKEGTTVVATPTITKDSDPTPITTGMVFTNTYTANSVAAGPFEATKTLYNRTPGAAGLMAMTDGQFQFQLTAQNGAPMPAEALDGKLLSTAGGKVIIPSITYTQAGTYVYTLAEVNEGKAGYTYDNSVYTITVTVADNGSGKLEVTSTTFVLNGTTHVSAMTFANEYMAETTGSIALSGTKIFNIADKNLDRKLTDGEFIFILSDASGEIERVTNVGNRFSFTALKFDRAGTYEYTVTELPGTKGGVAYDSTVHKLVITVTDDGAGQLTTTAKLNGADVALNAINFSFTNSYDVTDAQLSLTATKSMTGRQPLHDEFEFVLAAVTAGAPLPANTTVKNGYRGIVDFGTITYQKAGTYQYTIRETQGSLAGVTYDDTVYIITVTVTDNGQGALSAAVTKIEGNEHNDLIFRNIYKAEAVTVDSIAANKILTDLTPGVANTNMAVNAGDFGFKLTALTTGAPMPGGNSSYELTNGAGGVIAIPAITFTAPGTYQYTLEEIPGNAEGYLYDGTVYTITVTVTDNSTGKLQASVSYALGEGSVDTMTFENKFLANASEPLVISGTKKLTGRDLIDGEFSFTLTGPNVTGGSQTVKNVGETFTFGQLIFDAAGQYTYTVTEVKGDAEGVTYDETTYTITVDVAANGDKLEAKISSITGGNGKDILFTNSYKAGVSDAVVLTGNKNLVNITGGKNVVMTPGDGDFSFVLMDSEGKILETVSNKGGSFAFSSLTFDAPGTYTYTVAELAGNMPGISYDSTKHTVTITVSDDGTGKLKVDVQKPQLVFENTYFAKAATNVVIEAQKELLDITSGGNVALTPADGDFSFTLSGEGISETVKNKGSKVLFSGLSFTEPGTYSYTITEVKGNLKGIAYSEKAIAVTVTVTDNGQGQLEAAIAYEGSNKITNTFTAEAATLVLAGKKTLTGGRDLKAGEFSFNLKGNGVDETVSNDANGNFLFSALTFNKIGSFTYEITEVKGSDAQVTYDQTKYTVVVNVTYENGEMKATATVNGQNTDAYSFTNIFTPAPVSVDIDVQKILQNNSKKEMGLAGFSFQLTGEGKELTAQSGADGIAKFTMSFDKVGTYTFSITEVKGDIAYMTYDESIQQIKVTVTQDNATGELKATVEGTASFTNILAEEPPKTADGFNMNGWLLMMSVSAVGLMAVIVMGKKKLAE